jgi:hypothetical protein
MISKKFQNAMKRGMRENIKRKSSMSINGMIFPKLRERSFPAISLMTIRRCISILAPLSFSDEKEKGERKRERKQDHQHRLQAG